MRTKSAHEPAWTSRLLRRLQLAVARRSAPAHAESRSWAKAIKSYAEVPDVYKSFFEPLRSDERQPFPHAALTPTFKGIYQKPEREKLSCIIDGAIHVLENLDDHYAATCYRLRDVSFVEAGLILLYSWITIHGKTDSGLVTSTTLKYNTVSDHILAPLLEGMRPAPSVRKDADAQRQPDRFAFLAPLDLKFMNYGARSIRPGEKALQVIYQPKIRVRLTQLFEVEVSKMIAPAHLCILTECELILLRNDDSQRWLRGNPHGAIWSYVPRASIERASLSQTEQHLCALTLQLSSGAQIHSIFELSRRAELEQLLQQLSR